MKYSMVFLVLLCSCSFKSDKKYVIVSAPSLAIVDEMDDKEGAFGKARDLNCFGRIFPGNHQYFVLESQR